MKSVKVPAAFQELFGKRITLLEMWLILAFSAGMSVVALTLTYDEWQDLVIWKAVILILLIIDITGGVVANISYSTNEYYRSNAKARFVFIAAVLAVTGISLLLLFSESTTRILLLLFSLYMFKVIYSFSVDHYAERKM